MNKHEALKALVTACGGNLSAALQHVGAHLQLNAVMHPGSVSLGLQRAGEMVNKAGALVAERERWESMVAAHVSGLAAEARGTLGTANARSLSRATAEP